MLRIVYEPKIAHDCMDVNKWYVIDTPINNTGVCKEFLSEAAAKEYYKQLKEKEGTQ